MRFVDTNILIYAEDVSSGEKHMRARELILDLWDKGDGVVSVQVLQEFYVNVTRKIGNPLSARAAATIVREYLTWQVVENTRELLVDGMARVESAQLSFWDAMVIQAAISRGCDSLYSEDWQHGLRFGELQIINPFV